MSVKTSHGAMGRSAFDGCGQTVEWLPLAEPWRAAEFAAALRHVGALIKPADSFAIGRGSVPHEVRISLSGARSEEALCEGLKHPARTLRNGPQGLYPA